MDSKHCNRCKLLKPINQFYASATKRGLRTICAQCDSSYQNRRHAANRATYRERDRERARTVKGRFSKLKKTAKLRGLTVAIDLAFYNSLIANNECHYCHGPLPEAGGGVDRKDSTLGYLPDNVVPCCKTCNELRWRDNISYVAAIVLIPLIYKVRGLDSSDSIRECLRESFL